MDKEQFDKIIVMLMNYYRFENIKNIDVYKRYYDALIDSDYEAFKKKVYKHMETSNYFPKITEIMVIKPKNDLPEQNRIKESLKQAKENEKNDEEYQAIKADNDNKYKEMMAKLRRERLGEEDD